MRRCWPPGSTRSVRSSAATAAAAKASARKGLPVSDVLRAMMYADGYGEFALGREQFHTLPAGLQQVRCGDCGECTVKCPNGVRVVERLTRAQECFA